METTRPLAETFVWNEGKCYRISTIVRQSSATLSYGGNYSETLAWEYNKNEKKQGNFVMQDESAPNSLIGHMRVVTKIFRGENC